MRKHILVVMTAILVLALVTVAMAADPLVGTWKLNLAKSKYSPGTAPKSETVKTEAQENGIKSVFDIIDAAGRAIHAEFSVKYDGKDYPVTGNPTMDTVAYTKTGANTIIFVRKNGGKEVSSGQIVTSKDGKTATVTEKGKDAKGQEITMVGVFDKQ